MFYIPLYFTFYLFHIFYFYISNINTHFYISDFLSLYLIFHIIRPSCCTSYFLFLCFIFRVFHIDIIELHMAYCVQYYISVLSCRESLHESRMFVNQCSISLFLLWLLINLGLIKNIRNIDNSYTLCICRCTVIVKRDKVLKQ